MILGFLSGPIVNAIIGAYKAKLQAMNSTEAKAVELAEAEIKAEISARIEANKILLAEEGWWVTAIIRPLFAYPLILYFWKVVVYDTMFGLGSTPALYGMIGDWAGWIVVAYFGGRSIEKVARIFRKSL
jgi:hypothetical protein